jgi:hypothetical protein
VVLHRTEPEELRDQTAVRITCRLHPSRDLEPVDQPTAAPVRITEGPPT